MAASDGEEAGMVTSQVGGGGSGARRSIRVQVEAALVLFAGAMVFVFGLAGPVDAVANCTDGTMAVVAHQDDDTLFLNPHVLDAIDSGKCVTAVFLTAGNAGRDTSYWQSRERGAQAAYANMAGVADTWSSETILVNGRALPTVSLTGASQISLVFLRLPDNGPAEEQLEDLWTGARANVASLDGVNTFTRTALIETLTDLMKRRQPDLVLTQDYLGDFGGSDHSDHYAAGEFAYAAHLAYPRVHQIRAYEGYASQFRPATISGTVLARAQGAFFAYAPWDIRVCNTLAECMVNDPLLITWLERFQVLGSESGGSAASSQLTLSPATTVEFAPTLLGRSTTTALTVSNTGGAALTQLQLPGLSAPFAWQTPPGTSLTLAAGESRQFPIVFAPQTVGTATARLTISSDAGTKQLDLIGVGRRGDAALSDQVRRLYQAIFLREADAGGLDYWVDRRARGASLATIANEQTSAPEFTARYGRLTNAGFVDLVYRNVLGRAPDAAGRAYWQTQLDRGTSRGKMMIGFSEASEFVALTGTTLPPSPGEGRVIRLYQAYFLREPDAPGLSYWMGSGRSLAQMSDFFAGSAEFTARYGRLTDAGFVDLVYRNVLRRPADQAGAAYWRSKLSQGLSRGAVMTGFSESPEFIRLTETLPD